METNVISEVEAIEHSEFETLFEIKGNLAINRSEVSTIDEYAKLIRVLTDHWDARTAWFRGHSKEGFQLVPGIYRPTVWEYDDNDAITLEDEFIRHARSHNIAHSKDLSRWEWYQIMQHHGLPTRLLDWTSACNVGLFFAIRDTDNSDKPVVWVLDPFKFNEKNTGRNTLYYTDPKIQRDEDSITEAYMRTNLVLPELPLAVLPAHIVPRITAQHGCFTIHGRNKKSLEELIENTSEPYLAKISISNDSVERLRIDLAMTGIIETTLFPDLDGIARHLKWEKGMK